MRERLVLWIGRNERDLLPGHTMETQYSSRAKHIYWAFLLPTVICNLLWYTDNFWWFRLQDIKVQINLLWTVSGMYCLVQIKSPEVWGGEVWSQAHLHFSENLCTVPPLPTGLAHRPLAPLMEKWLGVSECTSRHGIIQKRGNLCPIPMRCLRLPCNWISISSLNPSRQQGRQA